VEFGEKVSRKHSMSVISSSCGIKPHTIRIWEKRYNLFNPERSENGQRLYSDEDITKAKLIVSLMDFGHSISSLAEYRIDELEHMKSKHLADPEIKQRNDDSARLKVLLKFLSNYEIDSVANELQHARLSMGAREFILDLVLPIIREIGLLVAKGKYSITQEHIISTIIRDQISQIFLPNLGSDKKQVALATPEGNLHEFSILIADILCRSHRITTRYLGATHPAQCLGEALNALKTPVLILGVISSDQWNYEKNIIPYLKKIDQILNYKILVILGGAYPINFPDFEKIQQVEIMKSFEDFDKYLEENV